MASRTPAAHRWQGAALLRATTAVGPAGLPRALDLDDPTVTRGWVTRVWRREEVRSALELASPALSAAVESVCDGTRAGPRQVRRMALSVASYLLRWQTRPTPHGLFAGTAPVAVGHRSNVRWGDRHAVVARADAEWVTDVILHLQQSSELLHRLPVVANNVAISRGERLVLPGPPADGRARLFAPVEVSVRRARPVAVAVEAAREPITFGDLKARLRDRFPSASANEVDAVLCGLVEQQFLLTSLWAPMATVDALGHLCRQLDEVGAQEVADVRALVLELAAIHRDVNALRRLCPRARPDGTAGRMRELSTVTATPVLLDTVLDAGVQIPQTVVSEVEAATGVLYRTTAQPYGYQHWRDYHRRFRARYGVGAVVPVMELVSDSGLGLPAGYTGSGRDPALKVLTARDELLMKLVQHATIEGRGELRLSDAMVRELETAAGRDERQLVPRVEVAFEVHASGTRELDRGDFEVLLTAVPRPGSSMAGRFAHLLPDADREALAATYSSVPGSLAAQLVFPPRRRRNENVTRTPRLLPHIIEVSGHQQDQSVIPLDDLAVTADARAFYLLRCSTGQPVDVRVLHALEASTQTPPLARFLAEISTARCAAYRPFDFGAAAALPYLPRVRYGRTVLAPARWTLAADELPGRRAPARQWGAAFDGWRDRLHVPDHVAMVEHDQRLLLDLTHVVHRRVLRAALEGVGRLELREASEPDAHGWIGRAHEIWISLGTKPTAATARVPTFPAVRPAQRPHCDGFLHAELHAHPDRYDDILTRYLPRLLARLGDPAPAWWFTRHKETARPDADQHLQLTFRLTPNCYGAAAEHARAWANELHGLGLASGLVLAPYQPQTGRYGHTCMDAANRVFAADSAAALAQIRFTHHGGPLAPQALAAASAFHLAAGLTDSSDQAVEWLLNELPRGDGKLDRALRDHTLELTGASTESVLGGFPEGTLVTEAWKARAEALDAYRTALAAERDPLTVARSLLHQHHRRVLGVNPAAEATTLRLVRAAALHHRMAHR